MTSRPRLARLARSAAAGVGLVLLALGSGCGGSTAANGTIVVLLSARQPGHGEGQIRIHSSRGWSTLGEFSGDVPAAPRTLEAAAADVAPGSYDSLEIGGLAFAAQIDVASGKVATALVGIEQGRPAPSEIYSGQEAVNLGLRELAGRYALVPDVALRDQHDATVETGSWLGKVIVVSAFSTTSEQQPALLRLYRSVHSELPRGTYLAQVTTNPLSDQPSVLSDYASRNGVDWALLTGEPADVGAVLGAIGSALVAPATPSLAIVDRHGYVLRRFTTAPDAPQLVDAVTNLGSGVAEPSGASTEPQFKVSGWNGATVDAATFAGRPLVINFWASWCAPCRTEMPLLDAAAVTHPTVAFLFVDERDDAAAARRFLDGLGIHSPIASDADGSAGAAFGVQGLPTTVFIRPEGTIEATWVGQLDSGVLDRHLAALAP